MKIIRRIKYYLIRLFRLKKGVRQISLGIIFGFFPCWFPTFGIGPVLSIALTKYVKGNMVSAIIAASLGSFMWPLLFYLNYRMGAFLTTKQQVPLELSEIDFDKNDYIDPIEKVSRFGDIGKSFVVGSIANSILFSIIGYFLFYYIFSKYREAILKKLS